MRMFIFPKFFITITNSSIHNGIKWCCMEDVAGSCLKQSWGTWDITIITDNCGRATGTGLFTFISVTNYMLPSWAEFRLSGLPQKRSSPMHSTPSPAGPWSSPKAESYLRHSHLPTYPYHPSHVATLPVPFPWPLLLSRQTCFSLLDYSPCNAEECIF